MKRAILALLVIAAGSTCHADAPRTSAESSEDFAIAVVKLMDLIEENAYERVSRGELIRWSIEGLYHTLKQPLPKELQSVLADTKRLDRASRQEQVNLLYYARHRLRHTTRLAPEEDVRIAVNCALWQFDPLSTYTDKSCWPPAGCIYTNFRVGIGVKLEHDPKKEMPRIRAIYYNSPAYNANLQPGDLITALWTIKGEAGIEVDRQFTKGMTTQDVYARILGASDTTLGLQLEREGVKKPFVVTVKRTPVTREAIIGVDRKANGKWNFVIDEKRKLGYIQLTRLSPTADGELESALKELSAIGLKGLILDLRFNDEGTYSLATKVADLFIDDGVIFGIKVREGKEVKVEGKSQGSYLDFPMVVLVNGSTRHASEIVAACLQDHGRAIIVGEATSGGIRIANVFSSGNLGRLEVTIGVMFRPSGKAFYGPKFVDGTNGWGVTPTKDYGLKLSNEEHQKLRLRLEENEFVLPGKQPRFANPDFKDRQRELALEYLAKQTR